MSKGEAEASFIRPSVGKRGKINAAARLPSRLLIGSLPSSAREAASWAPLERDLQIERPGGKAAERMDLKAGDEGAEGPLS